MRIISLVFLVLALASFAFSDCPSTTGAQNWSTLYSSLSAGANVNISSTVLLDVTPNVVLNSVTVYGTLIVKDDFIELKTGFIKVMRGGSLLAGGSDCPITNKVIFTFYGSSSNANVNTIGSEFDNGVTTNFGSKGLVVTTGGSIALYGKVSGPTWTQISQTSEKGSNTMNLKESVQWKQGDTVLVTSTDFSDVYDYNNPAYKNFPESYGHPFPDQNERAVVSSVSSDGKTVTLQSPLKYMHYGNGKQFAEVALLNRHIILQSDPSAESDKFFGGHLLIRKGKRVELSGIEVTRMGQRGILARYPVHFHNMREAFDLNPFLKDSSIHDNFQRCVVVHESHGVTIQNNVAYNTSGHCYFLEDGGEHGTKFIKNLGVLTAPTFGQGIQLIPSDNRPAIFWITNPNNTWIGNVAVNGHHGFWFAMPEKPRNLGKTYWDSDPFMFPRRLPLGVFDGNIAHSNRQNGIHIDEMENSDGTIGAGDYTPSQGPYTNDYPYGGPQVEARFTNFISYKNRDTGAWGHTSLHFVGCTLQDNARAFMVNGQTILRDSLITGESDNAGNPVPLWGAKETLLRSYPSKWGSPDDFLQGHSSYDNGGPQFSVRNTFENFVSTPSRRAGALVPLHFGAFMLYPRNHFGHQLEFINANPVWIDYQSDCEFGWHVLDTDGTVTGVPGGAWIQSNETHVLRDGCTWKADWNTYVCPHFGEGYVQFTLYANGQPSAAPPSQGYDLKPSGSRTIRGILRQLGSSESGPKGEMQGHEVNGGNFQYMHNVIARNSYALEFYTDSGSPSNIPNPYELNLGSSSPGDWIILALPYPAGTTFTITAFQASAPLTLVKSVELLSPDTYYFDSNNNHLYILLLNTFADVYGDYGFSNIFGFDVSSVGFYRPFTIVASCGSNCNPSFSGIPPAIKLPSALISEKYEATLDRCQSLNNAGGTNSGKAFFFFVKNSFTGNKELQYRIFHDLHGSSNRMSIKTGAAGSQGTTLSTQVLKVGGTFSTGSLWLSRDEWEKLVTGNLYVSVEDSKGNEILRGQIGCSDSGGCSVPPRSALALEDVCKPSYGISSIYSDNAYVSPVRLDSWNSTGIRTDFNYQGDVLCGNSSLKFSFGSESNSLQAVWWYTETGLIIDPKFKSVEFFVKVIKGYRTIPLDFFLRTDIDSEGEGVHILASEIDNFVVDENTWSRVRISLARLGYTSNTKGKVKVLGIAFNRYPSSPGGLILDEWRFSTEEAGVITQSANVQVASHSNICTNVVANAVTTDTGIGSSDSAYVSVYQASEINSDSIDGGTGNTVAKGAGDKTSSAPIQMYSISALICLIFVLFY